jgi:integrase
MKGKSENRGMFKRGRRWWIRLYVPGQGKKIIPLRPEGETRGTTNMLTALAIARDLRRQVKESGETSAVATGGDARALVKEFRAVNTVESSKAQAGYNVCRITTFIEGMQIRHAHDVTTERIQGWLAKLEQQGRSVKTLWNHKGAISRFCEFLIDRDQIQVNPCRRVKVAKLEKAPPRWLTPEQHEQALELAKQHGIHAEVATALYTGLRRDELRRLQWIDVDFERAVVIVRKSKGKRPRAVPMTEKLRAVLQAHRATTGKALYVFPGRQWSGHSGMRRGGWWELALKPLQAEMPAFYEGMGEKATGRGWHLFRHTFASRLVQAGVPLIKVSAWLGHANISTTMIYAHMAPGHDADIEKA